MLLNAPADSSLECNSASQFVFLRLSDFDFQLCALQSAEESVWKLIPVQFAISPEQPMTAVQGLLLAPAATMALAMAELSDTQAGGLYGDRVVLLVGDEH